MKQFVLFLAIIFTSNLAFAQPINRITVPVMIETAEKALADHNYYKALEWYDKAYEETKDPAIRMMIAELHYRLRDYKRAELAFKSVLRRDQDNQYAEKRFEYARTLKMMGKYEEAIAELDTYLQSTQDVTRRQLARAEKAGAAYALEARMDELATVTHAGKEVNTKNSEYSPILTGGGQELYYVSLLEDKIVELDEGTSSGFGTKILKAQRTEKGWEKPRELDQKINRPGYFNSNVTLSPDGRQMLFTRQLFGRGNQLLESKLYRSEWGADGWSPAQEVEGVNGDYIVKSPAFGELFGKKVIYFASNKTGGYGGYDIYYATETGEGQYGEATNLGSEINTVGEEDTPYYRDGTLYFSSTGHPGLGGYDVFRSEWNSVNWSDPVNMGKPFNSPVDDLYFMLDTEGYEGFLASNREDTNARSLKGKTCCNDIYFVSIRRITADLLATTFDASSGDPLKAVTLRLIATENNLAAGMDSKTNAESHEFQFPLSLDRHYRLIAEAENYQADTVEFNTVDLAESKTFEKQLRLKPLPRYITVTREEAITLNNIYYDYDDDKIRREAEPDLQFLYNLMVENPTMVIELSSHTDARGGADYNRELSQRRAESARNWILSRGIDPNRIVARGYGKTLPKTIDASLASRYAFLPEGTVLTEDFIHQLSDETQQEIAHQINRRTEFKIIDGPTSIKIEETKLIQMGNNRVDGER